MTYRIGGQVVDQGSGVADQPVFVVDTGDADPTNWTVEAATTTDADGSWSVVVSSGDLERYHAVTQFEDAGTLKNAESKPFVTGQPVVRPVEIPIQFEIPSPAISAGSTIPDTTAKRTDDDGTFTDLTSKRGVKFITNSDFSEVGYKISQNTSGFTTSYLYDFNQSTIVETKDVSNLTSLDTFSISHDYVGGREYGILLDNGGLAYDVGRYGSGETPTISTTDIDLVNAIKNTNDTSAGSYQNILSVGNP